VEVGWAGRRPRLNGEGGLWVGLGEGGSPREEEGGADWPMAKAQATGQKIGDGPKLKNKFFLNFN
jgi:hypothetical protein